MAMGRGWSLTSSLGRGMGGKAAFFATAGFGGDEDEAGTRVMKWGMYTTGFSGDEVTNVMGCWEF